MLGIFLDSETNGLNTTCHQILDISFKIVDLSDGIIKESFQSLILISDEDWAKSDPQSLEINGITREIVDQGRKPDDVASDILRLFEKHEISRENAVFICQNPSFDRAFFSKLILVDDQEKMQWPYHWLDLASMHWAKTLLQGDATPWDIGFTKDKIAKYYNIPSEATPHRAERGVDHLLACYNAVVSFPALKEKEPPPIGRN